MYYGFSIILDGIEYSYGPGYALGILALFLSTLFIDQSDGVYSFVVYLSLGSTWPGPGTLVTILGLTNLASN